MDGSYGLTGGLPPHAGCRTHLALSAQTPEVGSCHGRPFWALQVSTGPGLGVAE